MFILNGKQFCKYLKNLLKYTNNKSTICYLKIYKNVLTLTINNDLNKAMIIDNIKCKDKIEFGFDATVVLSLFNGKEDLICEVDKNIIKFKQKKGIYKGNFLTFPYEEFKMISSKKKENCVSFNKKTKNTLLKLLNKTMLTPIYENIPMLSYIKLSKNKIEVACADRYHIAYATSKIKNKKDVLISIPTEYIVFIKSIEDENLNISFDDNCIYLWNSKLELIYPLVGNSSENVSYNQIIDLMASIKPTNHFSIKLDSWKNAISNASAIYEEGSFLDIEVDDKIYLSAKTRKGKIKIELEIKKIELNKATLTIEPKNNKDILTKLCEDKEDIEIIFKKDQLCLFKQKIKNGEISFINIAISQ